MSAPQTPYTHCPYNLTCQPGTGIPSTSCKQDESCKPQCPPQKRELSTGDIAAIILGVLLLAAIAWILFSLFKKKPKCPDTGCSGICIPKQENMLDAIDSYAETLKKEWAKIGTPGFEKMQKLY